MGFLVNPFRFTAPPPFGITGLKLWLDSDDSSTITKDGSNLVSQWNDKSDQYYTYHAVCTCIT